MFSPNQRSGLLGKWWWYCAGIFFPTTIFAQAGSPDIGFGTNGQVITAPGNFEDALQGLLLQPDQKIIAGGFVGTSFTSYDFAMIRYHENGTPDSSFGVNGMVTTSIDNRSLGQTMALQSDGKILLGGASNWFIHLVRYLPDGSPDLTFGNAGLVTTDVEGYYSEKGQSMLVQNDGKILIGGYGQHNANDQSHFLLIRYLENGLPDSTFGTNGIQIGRNGQCNAIRLQADGKILMGGFADTTFALARYHSNGLADSTFGTDGYVYTLLGDDSRAYALGIQPDGKILLAGKSTLGNHSDFALVRYLPDGRPDSTFATNGVAMSSVGSSSAFGKSMGIESNGNIVLAGDANRSNGNLSDFAVLRYLPDGSPDTGFGNGGQVIQSIGSSYSSARALAIQADGKMLIGGLAYNGSNTDFALLRLENHGPNKVQTDVPFMAGNIFPNPMSTSAMLTLNQTVHLAKLELYDVNGQTVFQKAMISGSQIPIERQNLVDGIYFFRLTEHHQTIATGRFLIR